jgi:hypothetical protein
MAVMAAIVIYGRVKIESATNSVRLEVIYFVIAPTPTELDSYFHSYA